MYRFCRKNVCQEIHGFFLHESHCIIQVRGAPENVLNQRIGPLNLVDLWLRASRHLGWFFSSQLRTAARKDKLPARNIAARPVLLFYRRDSAPLFYLAALQCLPSILVAPTGPGGTMPAPRPRASCRIIPEYRTSSVIPAFSASFWGLYLDGRLVRLSSKILGARLSRLTHPENRT